MTERRVPWSEIDPLLEELGWSHMDLAYHLGLPQSSVRHWVEGGDAPVWLMRLLHLESLIKRATGTADSLADFVDRFRTPRAPLNAAT
jgi:hypothetical protein